MKSNSQDFEFTSALHIDLSGDVAAQISNLDAIDMFEVILQQPEIVADKKALSAFKERNWQLIEGVE